MQNLLKNSLRIGLFLELVVLAFAYFEANDVTSFFQTSARLSGRVSLLLFAFVVYYFSKNWKENLTSDSVWSEKYRLSRDFAIVHLIHWCFLAVAVSRSNFELKPLRIIAGAIAYLTIVAFPYLLKNKIFSAKQFFNFQNFYLYYVWFIMTMTYWSRVQHPTDYSGSAIGYQLYMAAAVFLLFLHFYFIFLFDKKKIKIQ
jgi:hypothetical protein